MIECFLLCKVINYRTPFREFYYAFLFANSLHSCLHVVCIPVYILPASNLFPVIHILHCFLPQSYRKRYEKTLGEAQKLGAEGATLKLV